MSKITFKKYRCGICGKEEMIDTNHFGEIYSGCKCGNGVRECIEPEALEYKAQCKLSKAIVHSYRFDIKDANQKNQYLALREKLKSEGRKLHDLIGETFESWGMRLNLDGTEVNLYNIDTFEDQYIGDGVRWHSWSERIVPNKHIKNGYYLELL